MSVKNFLFWIITIAIAGLIIVLAIKIIHVDKRKTTPQGVLVERTVKYEY